LVRLGADPNKCLAGKTKCVSKKIAGLLKCRAKCQQTPEKCGDVQTECEAKVKSKFEGGTNPTKGCFAKLEAKDDPSMPESVCNTTGDTAAVEAQVDTFVAAILGELEQLACELTNGGFCWFLGDAGSDCNQTCAAAGGTYDSATDAYAGGGAVDSTNCGSLLGDFGVPSGGSFNFAPAGGLGCYFVVPSGWGWDPDATTATASNPSFRRVCACQ
jgi:hypothetical protein